VSEEQKSENKVIELCAPRYDLAVENKTSKKYIILSSQRTGSSYIARRLCNVKHQFGFPMEYLNPRAIRALVPRLFKDYNPKKNYSFNEYIQAVTKIRTSKDGFFGNKVQPNQLAVILKNNKKLMKEFICQHDYIVLMTRKNKLEQSVSNAIATITDEWHPGEKQFIFDNKKKERAYKQINADILRFSKEEDFMLSIAKASKKPSLIIEYEDIQSNPNESMERLVNFLSQNNSGESITEDSSVEVPKKNSSELNQELKNNYMKFISGDLNIT